MAESEEPLFSAVGRSTQSDSAPGAEMRDSQVVRSRPVRVNIPLLTQPIADAGQARTAKQRLALNLFDDVKFAAEFDRMEQTTHGMTWIGQLRDVEASQVVMVVRGDIVMGNIVSPKGRYHIRNTGDGVHEVQEVDTSLFGDDEPFVAEADVFVTHGGVREPRPDIPSGDDGTIIDVMVAYTATTRAAAGGTSQMLALIDLAVAETNASYANSGIVQRVRLVHAHEVAYAESATDTLYTALQCITAVGDGCLDEVHVLRDAYGADLVSFWLENGGGYCGLAWQMSSISSSFAPYGFSTVARSCATGYYSFGHELGHNMGARHDEYVNKGVTPYPYAHGYAYPPGQWRTVMAYNNACTNQGVNCTRIPHWSNPSNYYLGIVTGNATADNRLTLNNTAWTVANFRSSATVGAGTLHNRTPVSNLSGTSGSEQLFLMRVPGGARNLQFSMQGGIGDADLYVRYGSAPTTSDFHCRPYLDGNTETCSFPAPTAGNWYVMIRGYSDYAGLSLFGRYIPDMSLVFWLLLVE